MKTKKVKTSHLIIGISVELIFSIFLGYTAGAVGFGSLYPQLNLVTKPFLCQDNQMSYEQNVTEIGPDTYWSARWFCVDSESNAKTEVESETVFLYATPFYSLVIFVILIIITYAYWNSSVGPAKNDGLYLW